MTGTVTDNIELSVLHGCVGGLGGQMSTCGCGQSIVVANYKDDFIAAVNIGKPKHDIIH